MRKWCIVLALLLVQLILAQPVTIRMMAGPAQGIPPKEATDPRSIARRAIFEEFHRQNPDIRVVNAGGLELVGERAESMFLMSMAGSTAPDVFYVNFRQYYNYIDQGFCRPLDDLIARDAETLARVNPTILDVLRTYDGRIYAIPWFQVAIGLYYRKDHFLEAGLDPNRPPRNWEELYYCCQKLVESAPGRQGFAMSKGPAYHWMNFLWGAGGEAVVPAENGIWKAAIATPEAAKAVDYFRKMVLDTWVGKDGKTYGPASYIPSDRPSDIRTGKVSMWFDYTNDVVLNTVDLPADVLGSAAVPAGPKGYANEINAGMWAINGSIKDPAKIEACWRFIKFFAGDDAAKINTDSFVSLGMGALVNPTWLKKFGYTDLVAQVDPAWVKANEEVFKTGHPEPYGRNCQQVYLVLDNALDQARLNPQVPAIEILKASAEEVNKKLLGYTPPQVMQQRRAWATGIVFAIAIILAGLAIRVFLKVRNAEPYVGPTGIPAGQSKKRVFTFMALCLAPAVLSLLTWSYYPLARGLTIAFQDYRIVKGTRWVGLDNFISVFTQPVFYKSVINSFVYVGLTIIIGFALPIFLALMLNEIKWGKVLFRTLFYLPAMTSPLVISLLWRQFYDKTDQGLLNVLIGPIIGFYNSHFAGKESQLPLTYDWLGDPTLAMFAVVLPGIWAAAGPGSILYLAALKNIPDERYEAADMDGATWWNKIRYITMPGLKPLILINLLGVFIGGFKAMENIFVLTGGGPLYSTQTMGLEIWSNAFMFLKFGYATAAAWVMGAILIGFTLIQVKSLLKMRFSTAKS